MSLMERALEAAGGARWAGLRHFKIHLLLDGALVRRFERPQSLKEIVAEGDAISRSMRISGFSPAGGTWGFHPDFVSIQRDDGVYIGARRDIAPRPFEHPQDDPELVYLCGLSIWSCLTAPWVLLHEAMQAEELGAWSEQGHTWWRLKVRLLEGVLAYSREAVMYFDAEGLLRRTDYDVVCGDTTKLIVYASAHQAFSGLTVPTLHRILRSASPDETAERKPLLDLEIFDAAFN